MTQQSVKYVVEEINTNYENYLIYLKQRNKQRQLLHRKTDEDLIKERLEKGFQLYFNAATKYLNKNSYEYCNTKHIFNNWGNKLWIGLNGIEILINNIKSMKNFPKLINISIINLNNNNNNQLLVDNDNLFKSSFTTYNLHDMWMINIDQLPIRIEFTYQFYQLSMNDRITLNIWNFQYDGLYNVGVKKCCLSIIYANKSLVIYNDILHKDIISTWGDLYYVGLNGIEIFLSNGINITSLCHITANPLDINILPEYNNDPRIITNLIDGINWTRDDTHMWLTPFTLGKRHFIEITLPQWITSSIALIRIWNYNKSRVHSYRGVKELIIYLDNQPIFYNEINKATGLEYGELEDFCETILFCTNNEILNRIDKDFTELTIIDTYYIEITLLEPWNNDSEYIGLTGIDFLDKTGNSIKIKSIHLNNNDNNDNVDVNHNTTESTMCITNLLNTKNHTTNINHMWYTKYNRNSSPPILKFYPTIQNALFLSIFNTLLIWNYNNRQIGYDYSCKLINIKLKKSNIIINESIILLRQPPGHIEYPYEQMINLSKFQQYTTYYYNYLFINNNFHLPIGFVYQMNILSNWSNHHYYYVGLDGIQLLSYNGHIININKHEIFTYPNMKSTLYNTSTLLYNNLHNINALIDNVISTNHDIMLKHSWLTTMLPNRINKIFIVFNQPICLLGIRLWNYMHKIEYGENPDCILNKQNYYKQNRMNESIVYGLQSPIDVNNESEI
ncbi:hypothetical protein EWB00_008010 [Schistosoma japonicum]|uniref:KATNIP domain-containing protein n=1 Tax=Schistosoma japonicum TaxID=6182 RepID=A0A4Z2CS16_SCHJA|nr:hypothetical protein EWB00_008010 [Schistosoma japonicum]